MADAFSLGNLYYTVSIDRKSLEQVRQQVKQVANSLGSADKGAKESATAFKELADQMRILETRSSSLAKQYRAGTLSTESYKKQMMEIRGEARALGGAMAEFEADMRGATNTSLQFEQGMKLVATVEEGVRSRTERLGNEFDELSVSFNKTKDTITTLGSQLRTLIKQGDTMEVEAYKDALAGIMMEAEGLRPAIDKLETSMGNTEAGAKKVSQLMEGLEGSLRQVRNEFQKMDEAAAPISEVDAKFTALEQRASLLSKEVLSLGAAFVASGKKDVDQYVKNLRELEFQVQANIGSMNAYQAELNQSTAGQIRFTDGIAKNNRSLRNIEQATQKASSGYHRMALGAQLNLGAQTLLNDRIFQLSPALGILTNQLMFATDSFKAFLRAALPIVAVAGALLAVIGALAASMKAGAGLEAALADVRKTTNLTDDDLQRLTGTFQGLAKEIPISTMELLDIAKVAGQLGITGVQNIEKFSSAVAQLSIATDVVGEQGATSLARFLQATGTATEQLGGVALQVGNVLNILENTTAATAGEILDMTSYTQGLASQAGASRTEILALNAAILALGVKAEAGGSAVVRTVGKIQVAATEGGNELAKFAAEADMTGEEFRAMVDNSPVEALVALAEGLGRSAEEGKSLNQVLTDLGIMEVRERRTLLALAQGHEVLTQAIHDANMEAIEQLSLSKEVAIQSDTVHARLKRLGSLFVTIAQQWGTGLLPVMHGVITGLTWLAESMQVVIDAHQAYFDLLDRNRGVPEDLSDEIDLATEALDRHSQRADGARAALGELIDVSGESGLVAALQTMSAAIDEDARPAFARFVDSTVRPLLMQGELQKAIAATIEHISDFEEAEVRAELTSQRVLQTLAQSEYDMAVRRYNRANEDLATLQQNMNDPNQMWGSDLIFKMFRREETLSADADAAYQDLVSANDTLEGMNLLVSDLEGELQQIEEVTARLEAATTLDDMYAILREVYGFDVSDLGGGGEELSDEARKVAEQRAKDIAAVFESIRSWQDVVGPALLDAGAIDSVGFYENLMSILENAIKEGARLGIDPSILAMWQATIDSYSQQMDFQLEPRGEIKVDATGPSPLMRENKKAFEDLDEWATRAEVRQTAYEERRQREATEAYERLRELEENQWANTRYYEDKRREEHVKTWEALKAIADWMEESRINRDNLAREQQREAELAARAAEKARDERTDVRAATSQREAYIEALKEERKARFGLAQARQDAAAQAEDELKDTRAGAAAHRALAEAVERVAAARERVTKALNVAQSGMIMEAPSAMGGEERTGFGVDIDQMVAEDAAEQAAAVAEAYRDYNDALRELETDALIENMTAAEKLNERIKIQTNLVKDLRDQYGEAHPKFQIALEILRLLQGQVGQVSDEFEEQASELDKYASALESIAGNLTGFGADLFSTASGIIDGVSQISEGMNEMGEDAEKGTQMVRAGVAAIGQALLALLPVQTSVANQVMEGFFGMAGAVVELIPGLQGLGPIISAAGSVFSRVLGDMSNGVKQLAEELDNVVESNSFLSEGLVQAFMDQNTTDIRRGGLLGFLGFTKQGMTEEAQEVFEGLIEIASDIAGGFASALTQGIKDFAAGKEGWKDTLRDSLRETIVDAVLNAFVEAVIMEGLFEEFFVSLTNKIANADTGEYGTILQWAAGELPGLMNEAEKQIADIADMAAASGMIDPAEEKDEPTTSRAGTNISEITGPTRDLLIDLLRGLSILPSWTPLFMDMRNDLRRLAGGTAVPRLPSGFRTQAGSFSPQILTRSAIQGGEGSITLNNVTIKSDAKSTRELVRDISKHVSKEKRGGR